MSQIKVTITDETNVNSDTIHSSSSTPVNTTINSKNGSLKSKDVQQNQALSKGMAVASMVANQTFSYMTSNVGKWTGSSRMQTNINNAMQVVSIGAMAYVSWPVALASVAMSVGTTALDTAYEQQWDTYAKDYAKKRVGELKGRGR